MQRNVSFTLFNIGINIHVSYLYIFAIALPGSLSFTYPTNIEVYPIFVVFISLILLVHELGHAFAARFFKCAIHSINFNLMGGDCGYEDNGNEHHALIIAAGGIAAQISVLITAAAAIRLVDIYFPADENNPFYISFYFTFIYYNILIIIINLIPRYGTDGQRIKELLRSRASSKRTKLFHTKKAVNPKAIFEKMMDDARK